MLHLLTRPAALVAAGVFVIQVAWIVAVPAFGGIDEIDHAYRAASVAEGYWAPDIQETAHGRGSLIRVPDDIVRAARDRCEVLPYMEPDNCRPVSEPDQRGNVLVASASSRYNPAFYWVVGTVAQPFEGSGALYAMRAATAVLCAALLLGAVWVSFRHGRSTWPVVGVISVLTPVFLYATSVAAPNGVQLSAALLMWCCGSALVGPTARGRELPLLCLFGAAVPLVVATHTTGPLWVALSFGILAMLGGRTWVDLWHRQRRAVSWVLAWLVLTTLASTAWTLTAQPNLHGDSGEFTGLTTADVLKAMVLWVLQSVGALPFRNEWMPAPVFGIGLVTFALFLVGGTVHAHARQRMAIGIVIVLSFAVPVALTLIRFESLGLVWQGRYTLPFAVGMAVVAASALDRRAREVGRLRVMIPVIVIAFGVVQTISLVTVRSRQLPGWPDHFTASPPPVAGLIAAGVVALTLTALGIRLATSPTADAPAPPPNEHPSSDEGRSAPRAVPPQGRTGR